MLIQNGDPALLSTANTTVLLISRVVPTVKLQQPQRKTEIQRFSEVFGVAACLHATPCSPLPAKEVKYFTVRKESQYRVIG